MEEKVGRNDPCPCGSGLKFKKCCFGKPPKLKFSAKVIKAKGMGSNEDVKTKDLPFNAPNQTGDFKMTDKNFRVT
jgi:hypothetical protein